MPIARIPEPTMAMAVAADMSPSWPAAPLNGISTATKSAAKRLRRALRRSGEILRASAVRMVVLTAQRAAASRASASPGTRDPYLALAGSAALFFGPAT
jgi:hypothetical protein